MLSNIGRLNLSDELLNKMMQLSLGEEVELVFDRNTSLYKFFAHANAFEEAGMEKVVAYLLVKSGYVTQIPNTGKFRIPAKEIEGIYTREVIPYWVKRNFGLDVNELLDKFVSSLENTEAFKKFIKEKLLAKADSGSKNRSGFSGIIIWNN